MRTTFLLLLTMLLACGSSLEEKTQDTNGGPFLFFASDDAGSDAGSDATTLVDASDSGPRPTASSPDSGSTDPTDASSESFDSGTTTCGPRIGHCLTNMATRCYETTFDDTVACNASGQSSGWHLGPCDLYRLDGVLRSNGGCLIGCDLSYSYPLGGGPPSDVSRSAARTSCEAFGGIFIDLTTSTTDGYDSGAN